MCLLVSEVTTGHCPHRHFRAFVKVLSSLQVDQEESESSTFEVFAIGRLVSSELVISAGWTKGGINPAEPLCVKYPSKAVSPDAALSLWTFKGFTVLQTNTFIVPALFCLTSQLRTFQCHLNLRHMRGAAIHKTSLKQGYMFLVSWHLCRCLKEKQETMKEVVVNEHCLL